MNTKRVATRGLLLLLTLVIFFHGLVLLGVVPFQIVWGGRLKDASQMLALESISILTNAGMLAVVGLHAGVVKRKMQPVIIRLALWVMVGLFLLNTIGNLASLNPLERLVFTPLTLLLSLFSFRLAISKPAGGQVHTR